MSLREAVIEIATHCSECGEPWVGHREARADHSKGCLRLRCDGCGGSGSGVFDLPPGSFDSVVCRLCNGAGGPKTFAGAEMRRRRFVAPKSP